MESTIHNTQLKNSIRIAHIARIKEAERTTRLEKITVDAFTAQTGQHGNSILFNDLYA